MFEAVYEIFDNHLKDRFEGLAFVDRAAHSVLAISALGHGPWSPRWSWPQQARGLSGGLPVLGGGPVADRAPRGLRRRRHHELHCQALEPNYGDDEGYPGGQGAPELDPVVAVRTLGKTSHTSVLRSAQLGCGLPQRNPDRR
ncbi:hypothetical protein CTAM01_10422 [Colletotrichum tamarilloi]|uniref:Uncharacterized protein n=1 Tax=Colletotrichum tamarilloi TaxID=1209934 RepID=A0ABQ9R0N6_9PEZI|nr:uncharacterized protein CTAM01_10422 [Colletotrichum tamarilloi]KAK1490929.1 hypothetical protein CTAM01_10422 [Colletotrichum tamarilloi]